MENTDGKTNTLKSTPTADVVDNHLASHSKHFITALLETGKWKVSHQL